MTIRKNTKDIKKTTSYEDDDYYASEKKRIAEETQKAHKIHELEIQSHLTAMIPYYDDAEWDDRRRLLLLNNLLINRFQEPGMMYWNIFRRAPAEIREYADIFEWDLSESDVNSIIHFLELKKEEEKNMVDIGFDEDGEEDEIVSNTHEDTEEDDEVSEIVEEE